MRVVIRGLGVILGLFYLGIAVYYVLGGETALRKAAMCAGYTTLGLIFLIYGIRGRLREKRKWPTS
jgi:hypothetical protein